MQSAANLCCCNSIQSAENLVLQNVEVVQSVVFEHSAEFFMQSAIFEHSAEFFCAKSCI